MSRQPVLARLVRKLDKTVSSRFFIDQWIILVGRGADYARLNWQSFQALIPGKDRYWGDPFVVSRDGCYYIFLEEKPYATGLGRILCLTLDAEGQPTKRQVVLERDYHLSYPFVFERDGQWFMVPETAGHRTIELYRCTRFPDRWEFVRNLMTGIYAVDSTLLEHEGKCWLFANVKAEGGSSLDALYLYYAPNLFAENWTAHPRNPIVQDIRSARPAGRIFSHVGNLIRPSQDSSRRYGYALKFNRIARLSETDYAEELEWSFTPRGSRYLATHTFNQAGNLTVIDAVLRRRK